MENKIFLEKLSDYELLKLASEKLEKKLSGYYSRKQIEEMLESGDFLLNDYDVLIDFLENENNEFCFMEKKEKLILNIFKKNEQLDSFNRTMILWKLKNEKIGE